MADLYFLTAAQLLLSPIVHPCQGARAAWQRDEVVRDADGFQRRAKVCRRHALVDGFCKLLRGQPGVHGDLADRPPSKRLLSEALLPFLAERSIFLYALAHFVLTGFNFF